MKFIYNKLFLVGVLSLVVFLWTPSGVMADYCIGSPTTHVENWKCQNNPWYNGLTWVNNYTCYDDGSDPTTDCGWNLNHTACVRSIYINEGSCSDGGTSQCTLQNSGYWSAGWTQGCTACFSNCSCASDTCIGSTCSDGCGGTCDGTLSQLPGTWSAWSSCSNCSQSRTCTLGRCGGGCTGSSTQSCGLVNGGWTSWSPSCSPACGQEQTRSCTNVQTQIMVILPRRR